MADLPRYNRAGVLLADVRLAPVAAYHEQEKYSTTVENSLDRMANWAFGNAESEAQREGLIWGAENPVSLRQLQAAAAGGVNPEQLFSRRGTHFGEAARAAQMSAVTTDLETDAQTRMAALRNQVLNGQIELEDAQRQMGGMVDGYGNVLMRVDPRAALKARASIATAANSANIAMTKDYLKKQEELVKTGAQTWLEVTAPEIVRAHIEAGDSIDPETGKVVTPSQRIDATVRSQVMGIVAKVGDPAWARQFMNDYQKMVSEAKVGALVKVAQDPAFARDAQGKFDAVGAVQRADAGDFGPYSSVFKGMTADEQLKVRTALRSVSADRYTAEQHVLKQNKERDELEVNGLVMKLTTASGADATRIVNRLREISVTTGAISGTQLNALLKARANGDGKEDSQKMLDAMTLVRRGGITSIADVTQKVPGLTKKQIEKLGDFIMDAGDRRLRETIRTMAGIPDGLVQMDGDQQRRFMKLNDMADRLKSEQIQSNGKWDTDLIIGDLRTRLAADAEEKAIEKAKAELAAYPIPQPTFGSKRTATLTADTPEKELKDLGFSEAQMRRIKALQKQIKGAQ